MHTSIIQILKLNEPRPWSMKTERGETREGVSHTAECLLLNADGGVEQVGVLKIRGEELLKKAVVGTHTATFALRANPSSRAIEAVLTDLTPLPPQKPAARAS